ncbi:hypothetical protein MRX96_021617 [Rhipicephalus microplus]
MLLRLGIFRTQTPSPAAPRRLQRASTGSDDYAEEVEVEGNFTPLIPLPEEVSVYTGEENEKVCFEERAKLFRYDEKEWKERGIGVVKLLENKEGKVRLLMRREQAVQQAQPTSVFKFGVPVPEQKPSTPVTSAADGTAPSAKNVFGGFTFSGPPKVKELPKEEAKPAASAAAALKESPKPSPFAGFSFKSPPAAAKKDEQGTASATQSFLAGARSEISKLSTTPAKQAQVTPSLPQPQVTSPLAKPSPPTSSGTRHRADSLRSPGEVPEDFVPSAEFEPVVSLPELVEVKTGEEDEEVLFCERAKLFRFDAETKQWKERGIGELKILCHPETQVCRVLMRRDQVLKLCANHRILPEMKLGPLSTNDRAWSWFANDYSEGQLCKENLAARFKTKEQADFFKQFKPKPGAWNCDVCYVSNPADKTLCLACETRRPGSENVEPTPSPLKALEKLAAPVSGGGGFPIGTSAVGVAPAKFTFGFPGAGTISQPSATNLSLAQSTSLVTSTTPKPSGFVFGSSRPGSAAPPSTFTFGNGNFQAGYFFCQYTSCYVYTNNKIQNARDCRDLTYPLVLILCLQFKFGSPQKYEFSFSGVRPRSPSKTPKSPGTPADAEEDESGTIESPEAEIFFQPLVPLPPKVEVRTGEEEEEVLYSHRAKLYRWMDGEWKERGLGDIKLLRHPTTQRTRLLMRREPVLKVCLNHLLTPEHQFSKKDDRTVTWSATDFSDDVACPYQFALRLKSSQVAEEFLAAVEKAKSKPSGSPLPSTTQPTAKPSTPVSASTFSFRLEDNPGMSPSSATTPAGGFSLGGSFWLLETNGEALAASSKPTGPAKSSSTKDAPHLAAADSTTGSREEEGSDGGLFSKAATGLSFADLAKQQPNTGFGFQGPSPKSGQSLFSGAGTKLFQSATSRRKSETEDDAAGADEVAPSVDIHFEPVVPLPDLVELRTGEEDEEQLFCHRAKLFVFDSQLKQWKERALGDIKILKHKTRPCCFRVVMRRDQVHKVACNHSITEFTKLSPLSTSSNSLTWKALDFSEGKTSPEAFAVRFKNAEAMNKFANVFEECRLAVVEKGSQPAASERNGDLEREQVEGRTRKEEEEDIDEEEDDDDDDEYEDDDEDDEHGEDIMFEKRITLSVQKASWRHLRARACLPIEPCFFPVCAQTLGMGNLKMVYDDSCFGARIRVTADDGSLLCDTIVAVQVCLRTERLNAYWSALDMSIEPNVRRHFKASFSSPQAVAEFSRIFTEAKELAVNSSIVETIDEPPSHPKYLAAYLAVHGDYAAAHKLMGQIQEALERPYEAIRSYKCIGWNKLKTIFLVIALWLNSRVKLLELLLDTGRVRDAFTHALQAEEDPQFNAEATYSLLWQRCVTNVTKAYHHDQTENELRVDELFLTTYLLRLDQLAILTLHNPNGSSLCALSGSGGTDPNKLGGEIHIGGCCQCRRIEDWFLELDSEKRNLYHKVFLRAHHRLSVSGHILHVLCNAEDKSSWLADVKKEACSFEVRKRIYTGIFNGKGSTSWFLQDTSFVNSAAEFPSLAALHKHDQESQRLHAASLDHLVWLKLQWSSLQDKKCGETGQPFEVQVFEALPLEPPSFRSGAVETLSQVDVLAFLEATCYCASEALKRKAFRPGQGPLALPPHVGMQLCTGPQARWWRAAYHTNARHALSKKVDLRCIMQRGLEVVRAIGNHGMDLILVVHLARTFSKKSSLSCADGLEEEAKAFENQAKHYWEAVLSKIESRCITLNPVMPSGRLFCVPGSYALNSMQELKQIQQEARMFLALNAMNAGCLDKAAKMFSGLTSARAAYYTALVMEKMAEHESPHQSAQYALQRKEQVALKLALERSCHESDWTLATRVSALLDDLQERMRHTSFTSGCSDDSDDELSSGGQNGFPPHLPYPKISSARWRRSSTPKPDKSFYPRCTPPREFPAPEATPETPPPKQNADATADAPAFASQILELRLKSLLLHQELAMSQLQQMQEASQSMIKDQLDSHRHVLAEVKQQKTAVERIMKNVDEVAARTMLTADAASRLQRQNEGSEQSIGRGSDRGYSRRKASASDRARLQSSRGPRRASTPPSTPHMQSPAYGNYPMSYFGYPIAFLPWAQPLGFHFLLQPFLPSHGTTAITNVPVQSFYSMPGQVAHHVSHPPPSTSFASSAPSDSATGNVGQTLAFRHSAEPQTPAPAPGLASAFALATVLPPMQDYKESSMPAVSMHLDGAAVPAATLHTSQTFEFYVPANTT